MTFGLRVSLTEKDKAALSTLATRAPHLVDAPWEERSGPGFIGIFTDALDADIALDLKLRGVDVVKLGRAAAGVREPIPAIADLPHVRKAQGIIEAVRPMRVPDGVPAEALFVAKVDGGGAQATLERLLLLDRDDALIGEIETADGRALVVKVAAPPLYLLYRAREEDAEGVRVFATAHGAARVFTSWGTAHPLASMLEDRLAKADRGALIDASGKMTLTSSPASWQLRPILDAVRPDLQARRDVLSPAAGNLQFPVRLRLGTSDPADPELWILTPEQLFKLESFVDTSPAEEVGRILVSRVADANGRAKYVVREAVRPQLTRLGPRVASLVESAGFARAPALDNLYLPPAKRLVPQLARDQLKSLLSLDAAAAVIIDEDGDGLSITSVKTLEDAPLTRFTTWIATDRRAELDRLYEDAVLSFPGVLVEKPEKRDQAHGDANDNKERAPRSPRQPVQPVKTTTARDVPLDTDGARDLAALRAQARQLEERVLSSHASDGASWHTLGRLKVALADADDGCACLEVAAFLDVKEAPAELARTVAASLKNDKGDKRTEPSVLDLALGDPAALTRDTTALLAARVMAALASGEKVEEEILHHTQQIFLRDTLLVGRRLQWAVLHAICVRANDVLGLTRAKEAVLGALNNKGLSETLDLPRFVRTSLALMANGPDDVAAPVDRSRHEQLVQLEKLFTRAVPQTTKLTDARDAFLRAIFAVGLGRLGGKAPDIIRSIENELDAHDAPNRALLRLYVAKLSHFLTKGTSEAWKKEVDAIVTALPRPEDRRVVEWLVKRSMWLRPAPPEDPPPGLRPALERLLADAEKHVDTAPAAMGKVQEMPGLYDYEVATAIERLLRAVLATGRDELIRGALLVALKGLGRIRILAHRVRALGSCVKAAATLEDGDLVDQCLDGISAAARAPSVPSMRDLLVAVKPALQALRRLGAVEAAQRFLSSLEPLAVQSDRETGPLLAALSDGFLQLGDVEKAKALIAQALQKALHANTQHVDRYEAGQAILEALTHWDLETRAQQCQNILSELRQFTDTFTTSRFFPTHQVLIAERLVETLADDVTLRSDRLQAYLDGEEQVIRRRILQQWSALASK